MDARWDNDIIKVQRDRSEREGYLAEHKGFITQVTGNFCRRTLHWEQDDELSVALIAFNEAIDVFNPDKGVPFLAFARKVIHNRLTDFVRKESRHQHGRLEIPADEEDTLVSPGEAKVAWDNYTKEQVDHERAEELVLYQQRLKEFGLDFKYLVKVSPKHSDTRQTLMRAACTLNSNLEMKQTLLRKRQLPLKELSLSSGIHLKTLERGRKFIISVAIILIYSGEFPYLREYIQFPRRGDQ